MLSANDKLIKLWKIDYRREKKYESCKKLLAKGKFALPRSKVLSEQWEGRCRSQFKNAHEYHINSLSTSADGEQFISADDLRVNLWNIEDNSVVYNLLDVKPESLDKLDEVITKAEFHPHDPNIFLYTTSKGILHICDLRESSSFQGRSSLQIRVGTEKKKTIFTDLVSSISSAKFMPRLDNVVATRDYLSLKIWDLRASEKPSKSIFVCDFVEKNLCQLYEDDSIYDKFFFDVSPDNKHFVSGNYNKQAHVIDIGGASNNTITTNLDQVPNKTCGKLRKYNDKKKLPAFETAGKEDYKKKVQHGAWSPTDNLLALAFRNCICLYLAKN